MQDLQNKIRAIQKTNEEIIERLEALQEVKEFSYHLTTSAECLITVTEAVKVTKVADIIKDYKFKGKFKTDIDDIFNDKIDWNMPNGWADLKRLNSSLLTVTNKFKYLDQSNKDAQMELSKYLHNLEVIQVELGSIEERTISQQSKLKEFEAEANELNQRIKEGISALIKKGASQGPPPPVDFFGGTLLDQNQAGVLTGWYGKGWKLQYKATRDGWHPRNFHAKCDGKGPTISVIQAGNNFFGGYLSRSWDNYSCWITDDSASLFTLTNPHGIQPTKLAPKRQVGNAYMGAEYGVHLGIPYMRSEAPNGGLNGGDSFYEDTTGKGAALFTGSPTEFIATEVEVYIKQ